MSDTNQTLLSVSENASLLNQRKNLKNMIRLESSYLVIPVGINV